MLPLYCCCICFNTEWTFAIVKHINIMIHYIYLNLFRLYLLSLIWSFVRSFKKAQLKYCTKYFFFLSLFHLDLSFEEKKKLFFSFNHVKIHFTLFVSGGRFVHVFLLIIDFKTEIRNHEYERKRTVWLVKKKDKYFPGK